MRRSARFAALAIFAVGATVACGADSPLAPVASKTAVGLGVRPEALLTVKNQAELLDGSAVVRLTIRCPEAAEVLEAHVSVSQDDSAVFGEAGISGVVCDGHRHRHEVLVTPLEGAFASGEAFASGFLLFLQGETTGQAQDAHAIRLRSRG